MDFGYELQPWAFGVHCACAGVALACLPFAAYYGALIKHRLVFMTVRLLSSRRACLRWGRDVGGGSKQPPQQCGGGC